MDTNYAIIISASGSSIAALLSFVGMMMSKGNSRTIHELEKNTNSIKDALVKSVGEAEYAKGLKIGEDHKRANSEDQ